MVWLWSFALLFASTVYGQKTTGSKTEPTKEAPKKSKEPAPSEAAGNLNLFPTVDLFVTAAGLACTLLSDVITVDGYRVQFRSMVDSLEKVPELGAEMYKQAGEKIKAHAPTAQAFVYEQAANAEVLYLNAKSSGTILYKEHLSEHLEPHITSAQLFYDTQVRHHVDTAAAQYAEAHPAIVNFGSRALSATQEFTDSATVHLKTHFDSSYPAAAVGAKALYSKVQHAVSTGLHPIEFSVGKQTLRFPNGIPDMVLAGVWILFLLYIALFILRYTFGALKCTFKAVKFVIFSVVFFVLKKAYKIVAKTVGFAWSTVMFFLGLLCFCWCCGTCGKRKGSSKKIAPPAVGPKGRLEKKEELEKKTQQTTNGTTSKPPGSTPPPPSKQDGQKSKKKK